MATTTTHSRDMKLAMEWYADDHAATECIDSTDSLEAAVILYACRIERYAKEDAPTVTTGKHAGDFVEALFAEDMRSLYLRRIECIDWHWIADTTIRDAYRKWRQDDSE